MFSLCFCLGLVALSFEYENLALNKPAYQQHPYSGPIPSHLTEASNAVDGLQRNLSVRGGQCVYSDDGHQTATLWINLTKILPMQSVGIIYMTGDSPWGPSNTFASRYIGFSIYVSNTTNKSEGKLCYKNRNRNTSTLISQSISVLCHTHGQYVFYYNERLKDVTYPKDFSLYAYNDVCELIVSGCPTPGYYGDNCSVPCLDPNCLYCDLVDGTCQGCKPGYKGHHCELECDVGHYGEACQNECGHCIDITQCHHENGTCLNGCKTGYSGAFCNKECALGHYGKDCSYTCGHCTNVSECSNVDGSCQFGCTPGYHGRYCKQECPAGFFGQNCSSECNKTCADCNKVEGLCDRGCHSGWKGNNCQERCNTNMYGANCTWSCGNCRGKGQCHHINGSCLDGCDPGFQGDTCLQVCDFGYYGLQCLQECSTFCNRSRNCHHVTGFCVGGCKSGWQGNECVEVLTSNACDTAWQSRFYGMTGAFCMTFVIFITYVMLTRKAKNRCFNKNDGTKSTNQKESRYIETYENEAADHGYQEMGEFNSSPATYYSAE